MIQDPFELGPTSQLPLYFDWAEFLGSASIASKTLTPGPGLTKLDEAQQGAVVAAWVQWSTAPTQPAQTSWVDCQIVTNDTPPRRETWRYTVIVRPLQVVLA